jgi:putative RNase toxin 17 of polymorphic toxin system
MQSAKIEKQIEKAGLPQSGSIPFVPRLVKNRRGLPMIEKTTIKRGPKAGKRGYVDVHGRIWVKDRAHADMPDHWDVQLSGGVEYIRVTLQGQLLD